MSILLVDIGNTRLKWALLTGRRLRAGRPVVHGGEAASITAFVDALARRREAPEQVLAVSVAGRGLEQALSRALRARFGVKTEFVRSTRAAAGVRNGYREVWRLGADRWVAALGAHALAKGRPALFALAGTALTIDLVTARGLHRGGAIIPGPDKMIDALLRGTQGIRRRAQGLRGSPRKLFAADTASALAAGARFAAAAFIDRAVEEATQVLGERPLLLLAGGAAAELRPRLRSRARLAPDLVLHGLARLARA